jgi:hypothetical protein
MAAPLLLLTSCGSETSGTPAAATTGEATTEQAPTVLELQAEIERLKAQVRELQSCQKWLRDEVSRGRHYSVDSCPLF